MRSRKMGGWIQLPLLFIGSILGLAGYELLAPRVPTSAPLALAEPGQRCTPAALESDEVLAAETGLSLQTIDRLRRVRNFDRPEICGKPAATLARAVARVTKPMPDKPDGWARFRAQRAADENGAVQPDGMIRATEQRNAMLAAQAAARIAAGTEEQDIAGLDKKSWNALGPGNIGGRIRSILIHPTQPKKMWIGSVAGGIWWTTDCGTTWSPVNDFMGNMAISSLAMDPFNANILYAGTGEGFFDESTAMVRGAGVFKSTDGGITWNQLAATNPAGNAHWYYVNRLSVAPNGWLLAATRGGIYSSTNQGATWTFVSSPLGTLGALDVKHNPNNSANFIVGYNTGRIETYLNGTWHAITLTPYTTGWALNGRVEIAWGKNDGVAFATVSPGPTTTPGCEDSSCGWLFLSFDGGVTWYKYGTPNHHNGQAFYDTAIWVDPKNSNT